MIPHTEFAGTERDLLVILADGMGGHASGGLASQLIVQAFADTFLKTPIECDAGRLWDCVESANRKIAREVARIGPKVEGMGSTLLSVLVRNRLIRWISVGDSSLFLVRRGRLTRLNQVHSRAQQLDQLVRQGFLTAQEALRDPNRRALTSAIIGVTISEVDDPQPLPLEDGDVFITASDGIETLSHQEIVSLTEMHRQNGARAVTDSLLDAVSHKNKPNQDNTTVITIFPDMK